MAFPCLRRPSRGFTSHLLVRPPPNMAKPAMAGHGIERKGGLFKREDAVASTILQAVQGRHYWVFCRGGRAGGFVPHVPSLVPPPQKKEQEAQQ